MWEVREGPPTGPEVLALLAEHLKGMRAITPPESVHALAPDGLRAADVTFWSVWEEGELLGCGALKELDSASGEIKSMRTAERHRRRGVATYLLDHLVREARRRGYQALYLETGATDVFLAARSLYARHGFVRCGPFGDYLDDPHSAFMALAL